MKIYDKYLNNTILKYKDNFHRMKIVSHTCIIIMNL